MFAANIAGNPQKNKDGAKGEGSPHGDPSPFLSLRETLAPNLDAPLHSRASRLPG